MPTSQSIPARPPWPASYERGNHAPSIFLQAKEPARRQEASADQVGADPDKACNRRHRGPLVKLDTERIKRMREEGRSWRAIAQAMGCSMGTVTARMEEDFPEFMRNHRRSPPVGASGGQHRVKAGS